MIAHPLSAVAATVCMMLAAAGLHAQPGSTGPTTIYPAKPLRIIVGQTAGGVSDLIARMVAQRFTEVFKQPALVENRAGAGGSIGTEMAVRATPDGYTLLLSSAGPIVINPALYPRLGYDPLRDLAPIGFIATSPLLLVLHPAVPAKNLKELIALAKSQPNRLSYGSGGNGSPPHLTTELFKSMTGVRMTHVPFKGSAPSVMALVGGQVDLSFSTVAVTLPQVKAGRIRALAVTSPQRNPSLPHLPTLAEAGPSIMADFESQQWFALFGPAALPREIITRINAELTRWLQSPDVRARLSNEGAEPGTLTLDQFIAFIRADAARWSAVVKTSGATAD